jgi:phage gp16-like protein
MASRANLAKIHIAKKDLGLDDDVYRDILHVQFKKRSSRDLSDLQCTRLLQHFESLGWKSASGSQSHVPSSRSRGRKPHNMSKSAYLSKIEALLAEAGRSWAYADGMAKHMYKVDSVQFCQPEQLRGIVAALVKNAKKQGRRTA